MTAEEAFKNYLKIAGFTQIQYGFTSNMQYSIRHDKGNTYWFRGYTVSFDEAGNFLPK